MFARLLLVLLGTALPMLASAAIVEIVAEVTAKQRAVDHLEGQSIKRVVDPTFATQTFTLVARFDLDTPWTSIGHNDWTQYSFASAGFNGPATTFSATPYSAAFIAAVPELTEHAPMVSVNASSSNFVSWLDTSVSQQSAGFGTGMSWSDEYNASFAGYDRGLSLWKLAGPVVPGHISPLIGGEFFNWLQGFVGQTITGGYNERYIRQEGVPIHDAFGNYIGVEKLDFDAVYLSGDFVVQSVTTIPIPAVGAWMYGSAALIGLWFRKRRNSAAFD